MKFSLNKHVFSIIALNVACAFQANATNNAAAVLSFDQGVNQFQFHRYDNPAVALGDSPRNTGGNWYVTPFNNPWGTNDVVSVGTSGSITLRLENYITVSETERELGIFTFQQLLQGGGSINGVPGLFYDSMQASLEVSQDGYDWIKINNGNLISFDIPANAYNADQTLSDYGQANELELSDLSGLGLGGLQALYNGSAGGTWIDLSETGLEKIGYVRFETKADQLFSFQLEGISGNSLLTGDAVPEGYLGDAQGDGIVNELDLQIVKDNFGSTSGLGDVNYDGVTDLADLFEVRNRFGQVAIYANTTVAVVPEPSTLLLGVGCLAFWASGKRKRQ